MITLERAHRALDKIARFPLVKHYFQRQYEAAFKNNRNQNFFRGVFPTFEEAEQSAPKTRPVGYDNSAAASLYVDRTRQIYATDYPVMFWLRKILDEGNSRFFDLGGHIGVSYYSYQRYLTYPSTLRWMVHDVPAVMEQGRRYASEKDRDGYLGFCDNFEDANHMDLLMAQGSLQYLPDTLAERLQKLTMPPRHLLLNLTPLHDTSSYFTLQSIGAAFCPYRITAVIEFIKSFEALGYSMVDHWHNPEKTCLIPQHPDHSLEGYHGFYFCRK
jgi:putative methyltransferase (TIGR04325 family)